ncbi:MAG: hypothetical protein IJM27_03585 [Eubacterium sp.]|nr:hypothetical protein [Eubacterium sp.]
MEFVEDDRTESRSPTDVNEKVTEWLARQFDTQNWNITDLLKTQNATVYLLIWPIMEQKLFSGFMQGKSIDPISDKMGPYFDEMDAEDKAHYFYDRYQNRDAYNRLTSSKKYKSMEEVLEKDYGILNGKEKMILMMTTVFRYRNNIFHGNKAIGDWIKYSKEIEYCTEFMMSVVDVYKKHFSEDESN